MRKEKETSWRTENRRPPAFMALAIAAMAITGFGLAGAFVLGSEVASKVSQATGQLGAEKISPQVSNLLHNFVKPKGGVTSVTSTNWGGYATTGTEGTIVEAYAIWSVPSINCDVYPSLQDNWVGIDGFNTGTVEQGGTYAYCDAGGGGPYYWTWFEFYPYESIVSVSNSVTGGDLVQAYVLYQPDVCYGAYCGVYTIVVQDLDNSAASFMVQGVPSTCNTAGCEGGPDGSAECISESLTNQGYYLPDYGTSTMYCSAVINGYHSGIGSFPSGAHATVYKVTTYGYDSGKLQQKVSKLSTFQYKDDTFTVTWKRYD